VRRWFCQRDEHPAKCLKAVSTAVRIIFSRRGPDLPGIASIPEREFYVEARTAHADVLSSAIVAAEYQPSLGELSGLSLFLVADLGEGGANRLMGRVRYSFGK
jgi:hypothetical protein